MIRKILAVIAGIIVAIVIVQLAELGVHRMHPFPPGMNEHDMAAIKAFVATLPVSAMVLVLVGWFVGTLAGTFTAAKISRGGAPPYVTGGLLFVAGVANAVIIPQPAWFTGTSLVIYLVATLIGARAAQGTV